MSPILSVPGRFLEVLASVGTEQPAYVDVNGVLSYGQLDLLSGSLAAEITRRIGRGSKDQQRAVALFLPHSKYTFTGILGVLRTGHFYLPLDTEQVPEFLSQVLQDCPPALMVTTSEIAPRLLGLAGSTEVLLLDRLAPSSWDDSSVDGSTIAAVLYTSGSTGTPRGVMRPHASFVLPGMYDSRGEPLGQERIASLTSYAVAAAGRSIVGVMMSGSTAFGGVLKAMSTRELCDWIIRNQIQMLLCPPGIFRALAAQDEVTFPDLKTVTVSMEPIDRRDVEAFGRRVAPGTHLNFMLAATECAAISSFVVKNGEPWQGERTPAGYAHHGVHIEIVDEDLNPVPPGTTGQIVVSSPTLSLGYWNRPVENQKKFGTDAQGRRVCFTGDLGRLSKDGLLEHQGRMDFMVKIRGYRVEPVTIEAALERHPGVAQAIVTSFQGPRGAQLVAYCVPRKGQSIRSLDLRDILESKLPSYMVPSRIMILDSLPLNKVGKIDRKALPPPGSSRPDLPSDYAAAKTKEEQDLVELWEEILAIDGVGTQDNFFKLGGDSLSALEMVYRVEQMAIDIPEGFFESPTIATLTQSREANLDRVVLAKNAAPALRIRGPLRAVRQAVLGAYFTASWLGLGPAFYLSFARLAGLASTLLLSFWGRSARSLQNYAQLADLVGGQSKRTVRHQVMKTRAIQTIWGLFLDKLLSKDLARLSTIEGSEVLAAARTKNDRIILVSYHTPIHRTTGRLFDFLGYPSVGIFPPKMEAANRSRSAAANTLVLKRAATALRRGEMVRVYPDGEKGTRPVVKDFLGVPREFFPGFAELASRENATVVAMGATMGTDGSLTLRIGPIFDDDKQAPHDDRVSRLQEQYVSYLESQWKNNPADVNPRYVRDFLALRGDYSAVK